MQFFVLFGGRMLTRSFLVGCVFLGCHISNGRAATLSWDFNGATAPNPADGSGNWLTANDWWNSGAGVNSNGNWTATGPDSAVFGAGTSGTYAVNLGGGT